MPSIQFFEEKTAKFTESRPEMSHPLGVRWIVDISGRVRIGKEYAFNLQGEA
jgi:hypothetical protein